jgi:hypothetical protein
MIYIEHISRNGIRIMKDAWKAFEEWLRMWQSRGYDCLWRCGFGGGGLCKKCAKS